MSIPASAGRDVRALARRLLPRRLLGLLPTARRLAGIRGYPPREVTCSYDQDWSRLPEVDLLRTGALRSGARVFDIGAHQGVVALVLARTVGLRGRGGERAQRARRAPQRHVERGRRPHRGPRCRVGGAGLAGVRPRPQRPGGRRERCVGPRARTDHIGGRAGDHPWPPDVLYLDVEGFEAVVLTGARQNLASRPDCVIEVHARTGLEKFGHALADIRPFLPDDRYRRFVGPGGVEEFTGSSWPTIVSLTTGFFLMALARRSPPVDRE